MKVFGNKKRNHSWWKDLAALSMPAFMILSELLGNPSFYIVAIVIAIFMMWDPFAIFPAYFIASLSSTYFSPIVGLGAGRVFSIILILSLLIKKDTYKHQCKIRNFDALCIGLILFNFFSSVISVSGTFISFFMMLQNLLVLLLIGRQRNVDLEELAKFLWWASAIVLIGIAIQVSTTGIAFDTAERYKSGETNENNFAMMCAQLGSVMLAFAVLKKDFLYKYSSIGLFLLSLLLIFLAGSRSAVIGLLGSLITISVLLFRGQRKSLSLFIVLLFIAIPVYYFSTYAMESDSFLMQRFSLSNIEETGGSGRMGIIRHIFTYIIPYHLLFGVGIGGLNIIAAGVSKPAHNILIDPLSQVGIFGVFLYWSLILPIITKSIKSVKINHLIILPLALFFTGLFNGIGETIFWEKFFWNSISLCVLFYNVINYQSCGKIQNAC